jgi:hypothetical protein
VDRGFGLLSKHAARQIAFRQVGERALLGDWILICSGLEGKDSAAKTEDIVLAAMN